MAGGKEEGLCHPQQLQPYPHIPRSARQEDKAMQLPPPVLAETRARRSPCWLLVEPRASRRDWEPSFQAPHRALLPAGACGGWQVGGCLSQGSIELTGKLGAVLLAGGERKEAAPWCCWWPARRRWAVRGMLTR